VAQQQLHSGDFWRLSQTVRGRNHQTDRACFLGYPDVPFRWLAGLVPRAGRTQDGGRRNLLMEKSPAQVTQILEAVRAGNEKAEEELLPLVYHELRRLAAAKMAHAAPGQTLQPTALVHEA
jgi:hypothetical protein